MNSSKLLPVVIVGGGFAGLTTAIALSKLQSRPPIVLIEPRPRFVFTPLLYELLSGELQAWEVAPSYSFLLSGLGISFVQASVEKVDLQKNELTTSSGDSMNYSQIVLSTGSIPDDSQLEGVQEKAMLFNQVEDAVRLQEIVKSVNQNIDPKRVLVVIGAGSTGVELVCKLADVLEGDVEIHLIELEKRVFEKGKSFNQEQAELALRSRGVKIYLQTRVLSVSSSHLELETKKQRFLLPYNDLVWTGGTKPKIPKLIPEVSLNCGKLPVDEYLRVLGLANVLALGDIAIYEKEPLPATAQVAMQQGMCAAKVIMDIRSSSQPTPFEFFDYGEMLSLGVRNATITSLGITIAGPLAFHLRRMSYLLKFPRLSSTVRSFSAWLLSN